MSPDKRLSRKRFRALCERCYRWKMARGNWLRTKRFVQTLVRANARAGDLYPYTSAHRTREALARLAR